MPPTGTLYVANAGDGSVRLYQGPDFAPAGSIALGDDVDNIRIDPGRNRIVVGYGKGGLAIIDPASGKRSPTYRSRAIPRASSSTRTARGSSPTSPMPGRSP